MLRRDANAGISDFEANVGVRGRGVKRAEARHNFASCRELNGVVDEIGQNLADANRIPLEHHRDGLVDVLGNFETFLMGTFREELDDFFDNLTHAQVGVFQFELARFNFGKIEALIDDP